MATVTMIEAMGRNENFGLGSAPLTSFKHIERHSASFIKKHKRTHRTPHVTCKADEAICTLQAEMRLVKRETTVDCRFNGNATEKSKRFANVLMSKHVKQEESGFENDRLFSVHMFLADDPKPDVRPGATSMGVKLLDVAIMSVEWSGNLFIVTFSGMDAKMINI